MGQGLTVTPLQLASAYATIANGGRRVTPHLVEQSAPAAPGPEVISEETSAIVRGMLQGVVDEGSGHKAQIPGYTVAGKTGTSQKVDPETGTYGTEYVASFVGFAPATDPEYVALDRRGRAGQDVLGGGRRGPPSTRSCPSPSATSTCPRTVRPAPRRPEWDLEAATLGQVARILGGELTSGDGEKARARGCGGFEAGQRRGPLLRPAGSDRWRRFRRRGATCAGRSRRWPRVPLEVPTIVVEDVLEALQRLARWTLAREEANAPSSWVSRAPSARQRQRTRWPPYCGTPGSGSRRRPVTSTTRSGSPSRSLRPTSVPRSWCWRWARPTRGT